MKKGHKVTFSSWDCYLVKEKYTNGRTALILNEEDTHEEVLIATVNIPGVNLASDEVIIKDYSENEGVLKVLVDAGIVSAPIDHVENGFVTCPICKLLV